MTIVLCYDTITCIAQNFLSALLSSAALVLTFALTLACKFDLCAETDFPEPGLETNLKMGYLVFLQTCKLDKPHRVTTQLHFLNSLSLKLYYAAYL